MNVIFLLCDSAKMNAFKNSPFIEVPFTSIWTCLTVLYCTAQHRSSLGVSTA